MIEFFEFFLHSHKVNFCPLKWVFSCLFHLLLTKLVLSDQGLGDAWWPTAKLVLSSDSEDILLPLNEFGDGETDSLQGGGDGDPANLVVLVVLLLQDVVQDLATTIIFRRLPVTDDRSVPDLIKLEVDWRARFICERTQSGPCSFSSSYLYSKGLDRVISTFT